MKLYIFVIVIYDMIREGKNGKRKMNNEYKFLLFKNTVDEGQLKFKQGWEYMTPNTTLL